MDTSGSEASRAWLALVERIDQACDRLEQGWRTGNPPPLEELLAEVDEVDRSLLLGEALTIELAYRCRQGDQPSLEQYHTRWPQFRRQVDEAFARLQQELATERSAATSIRLDGGQTFSDVVPVEPVAQGPSTLLPNTDDLAAALNGVDDFSQATANLPHPEAAAPDRYARLLATAQPFDELPDFVCRMALDAMQPRTFASGELLLRQGAEAEHLLVLVEGTADVRLHLPAASDKPDTSTTRHLARVGPGTVLGEISLLTFEPCTADVVATGGTLALALPAAAFRDVVARHPPVGPAFHRLMAERLGQNAVGTLDALSGKSIEGYRILRCIGQGGMGVVYEGEELASGGRVALKMMSHRLAYNSKASDRFRREVEIGQTLNHPNVLRVYAWFMAFNTQFMAMEYCDGTTLHHLLRRRAPLDNASAVGLVGQLAAGLDHVHKAGMVHRDLKPANVMLDRCGIVKLTDFGLARVCAADTDLTGEGEVLGTLRYMAPEQLLADVVDWRADLYSLGCLVYELITGRPLFRSSDPLKLMTERCRWRLPPAEDLRPDLDPRLYHVLQTTLHDAADNRTLDLAEAAAWAMPVVWDVASP